MKEIDEESDAPQKTIISELEELYEEGDGMFESYRLLCEEVIPDRFTMPVFEIKNSPFVQIERGKPAPEQPELKKFLDQLKKWFGEWNKSVEKALDRTGKIGYKLRFNSSKEVGMIARIGDFTKNEQEVLGITVELGSRVIELRNIIIDYE